jgi:hypothetical protein
MNKLMIVLALLMGAVFFGAVTANAQGCPSGQRSMGRCLAGSSADRQARLSGLPE